MEDGVPKCLKRLTTIFSLELCDNLFEINRISKLSFFKQTYCVINKWRVIVEVLLLGVYRLFTIQQSMSKLEGQNFPQGISIDEQPTKPTIEVRPPNYYNQLDSQLSAHQQQEKRYEQLPMKAETQQISKNSSKFKLVLPSIGSPESQEERNNNAKGKRVLIAPDTSETRQAATKDKLKIYDLEHNIEEKVEDHIANSTISVPQKSDLFEPIQQSNGDRQEEQNNSFLDVAERMPIIVEAPPLTLEVAEKNIVPNDEFIQNQQNRLANRSKVRGKQAPLAKGAFFDKPAQNQEYVYVFRESPSKSTFDSGLQVTSVHTSRDQLSTRGILPALSNQKVKRHKLPQLKPYKEGQSKQVYSHKQKEMPSQHLLKEPEPEVPKIIERIIPWARQRIIAGSEIQNVPQFVRSPIPIGRRLQSTLTRNKSCTSRYFLDYDLSTTDGKYLMSLKKMAFCFNSTYNISLANRVFDERNDFFLAKVQGNFIGSVFNLFIKNQNSFQQLEIAATIYYKTDCSCCSEKFREIEIYLKNQQYRYFELEGTQLEQGRNLKDLYQVEGNRIQRRITKYVTKQPKWNTQLQAFTMNFHGRSKHPSVKNTIIVSEEEPDQDLLLIAKQAANQFAFDAVYPFSPLIAIGVMITGFDFRLASQ